MRFLPTSGTETVPAIGVLALHLLPHLDVLVASGYVSEPDVTPRTALPVVLLADAA